MIQSHLILNKLERSNLRSLRFGSLIFRIGANLCHMLIPNNVIAHIGSPIAHSHLALSDLERSNLR